MQAITIAIGKTGINFFSEQYLKKALLDLLGKMNPPDLPVAVPDFTHVVILDIDYITYRYSNIVIQLSQGAFSQFAPAYNSVTQSIMADGRNTPVFTLNFSAGPFGVAYNWEESYVQEIDDEFTPQGHGRISQVTKGFNYTENFQAMDISVPVQFAFDTQKNEWTFSVPLSSAVTKGAVSNIPHGSVLHQNDAPCQTNNLLVATQAALDALNFSTATQTILTGIVQTIPGSGNLGNSITYDFSVGDSGILFPNDDGIQIGVKGGASYQDQAFPGNTAVSLPLPTPLTDADSHHLNLFVSDTEIEALCWCFFKAGKLNLSVGPNDLPNPSALDVSQYTALEPALKPYAAFVMQAQIDQNTAPTTNFQAVWQFGQSVMNQLKTALPASVFQQIQSLQGNIYASQTVLEAALQAAGVGGDWFATIEKAAAENALVLAQDITMTLTIQNDQPVLPNIVFQVQRTDLLDGLQLGVGANQRQTLQFGFANVGSSASFVSSNIPGFNGVVFESAVWPLLAESQYMQTLKALGQTGVPLPIMEGFRFDFANAQLSVEENYVSILANVLYQAS